MVVKIINVLLYLLLPHLFSVNYAYIHNHSLLNRFHDDSKSIVITLRFTLWYLLKVLLFEKVSKLKIGTCDGSILLTACCRNHFYWMIAYLKQHDQPDLA